MEIGDLNNDGFINVLDLSILVSRWGTSDAEADLNNDGTVDAVDLSILVSNWGEVTTGEQTVINVTLDDDGTDQTASLISQINAAPDGNATDGQTIIMLPAGNYRIDGTIELSDRSMVTLRGPAGIMNNSGTQAHSPGYIPDQSVNFVGYTNLHGGDLGSDRRHVSMSNCTDCQFQYINFIGPNDERDSTRTDYANYAGSGRNGVTVVFEHGFAIYVPSRNCKILDCYIKNVYGDGLYIGGGGDDYNGNVEVSRFGCDYAGRQNVGLVNCRGFYSEDTRFEWGARSGWDLEPNHRNNHVWGAEIIRSDVSCIFSAFVLNSPENLNDGLDANSEPVVQPRFHDVSFTDCTQLRVPTTRGPYAQGKGEPCLGTLTLRNLRGPVDGGALYWDRTAIQIYAGWPNIVIEDCDVNSEDAPDARVIGIQVTDPYANTMESFIVRNNQGGAAPEMIQFDAGSQIPASIIANGNTWDGGNQND